MEPAMIEWWHQALIKSFSCMCLIPACACRQRNKPKHRGKRMSSTSKTERPRKQPAPGGKILFAYEKLLCINGTYNDCAARHHCIGVVKIIF